MPKAKAKIKSQPPLRALLLAGLSLPFWLSLTAVAVGTSPGKITNPPKLPSLVFDQYLVDFREITPTEEIVAQFAFKNTGSETLRIKKLVPSCGCLQPQIQKKVYEPRGEGQFFLRVQTANQEPGQKEYSVQVQYEDPEPRVRNVTFKVILPENQVLIRPKSLSIYQPTDQTTVEEVVVTDLRTRPLEIIGTSSSSEHIHAEALPPERNPAGGQRQRIRITVRGAVPPGRRHEVVKIYVDDRDPAYHELRIPILLSGPSQSDGIVPTSFAAPVYGPAVR